MIQSIFIKVISDITILIFKFFCYKVLTNFKTRRKLSLSKKKDAILKVTDDQIHQYNIGRVKNIKEREEAINFLKYDFHKLIEKLEIERLSWLASINSSFFSNPYINIIIVFLILFRIIRYWLDQNFFNIFIYGFFGGLFLIEIFLFLIWIFEGKIIQRNFTNIFNEINHALLILGPKLNINLLDLISSIYTKDKFADPRTIQERLAQFGFIVDRNEIMRVSLSFILRNKNPDEKRKIVSRIIGSSTENFENYKSIPDDKRMDIEMLFLNDYIDNPFAEVQIISLN